MPNHNTETPPPRLSVIVPHYQDEVRLRRCLDALGPQISSTGQVELIVVDNNSANLDVDKLCADYPSARILVEYEQGAASARNRGIVEANGEHLLFIDSDCLPADNWVAAASDLIGLSDIVGGLVSVFDETPAPRSGSEAFETVFAFNNRYYVEKWNFTVTANMLTRRELFDAVGFFKSDVSEDKEWCLRACAAGFKIAYSDELAVSHPSRADWPALRKKWRRLSDEAFGLNGSSFKARTKWLIRAILVFLSPFAHVPKVLGSPKLSAWGERLRALETLFRLRTRRAVWMIQQALWQ
ncbi:MAG: glycosyltransferase [Pseudomonadota bacterium]